MTIARGSSPGSSLGNARSTTSSALLSIRSFASAQVGQQLDGMRKQLPLVGGGYWHGFPGPCGIRCEQRPGDHTPVGAARARAGTRRPKAGMIRRGAAHLRHRPPESGHGLDRVGRRLRGAQGPARPAQRVRAGAAGGDQRADALGARAQRRGRAGAAAARDAARLRRDAHAVPARRPRRAGPRGRPDHGARRRRPRADRRRRRRPGGRDDRARAGAPLRARVARGVAARRPDRARRDRRRARGRAAGRRAGRRGHRPRLGAGDGERVAAARVRRGRRGRGRRPPAGAAGRDRGRRRAAGADERDGCRRTRCSSSPARAASPWSPRRSTAT